MVVHFFSAAVLFVENNTMHTQFFTTTSTLATSFKQSTTVVGFRCATNHVPAARFSSRVRAL